MHGSRATVTATRVPPCLHVGPRVQHRACALGLLPLDRAPPCTHIQAAAPPEARPQHVLRDSAGPAARRERPAIASPSAPRPPSTRAPTAGSRASGRAARAGLLRVGATIRSAALLGTTDPRVRGAARAEVQIPPGPTAATPAEPRGHATVASSRFNRRLPSNRPLPCNEPAAALPGSRAGTATRSLPIGPDQGTAAWRPHHCTHGRAQSPIGACSQFTRGRLLGPPSGRAVGMISVRPYG
jgi:hypothetical protein